jgi:hypothetical protein
MKETLALFSLQARAARAGVNSGRRPMVTGTGPGRRAGPLA